MDFSWPIELGVNQGISKDCYMGMDIHLTYPTVDTLARRIAQLGVGIAVFKKDLKSAFRQLLGDPFDFSLMIYQWGGAYYVDLAVAMDMRSVPSYCQRISSAITYIHQH